MTGGRVPRGALREPLALTLVSLGVVAVLLLAGQAAQLSRLLGGTPEVAWPRLLGYGLVALGEVLLPVGGLAGAALAFGRWRSELHLTALWSLGVAPHRVLAPVLTLGVALGLATAGLSSTWGPRALQALSLELNDALARAPWGPAGLSLGRTGVLRGVVTPEGRRGELWGAVGVTGATESATEGPTLFRAEGAEVDADGAVRLTGVHLWGPELRAVLGRASLVGTEPVRRPGALRPPNTVESSSLDPADPLSRWSLHRRFALAALAPLLTLLGALLGGALGRTPALVVGAALMGLCYWGLRLGSLGVRTGAMSPVLAGWMPVVLVAPAALLIGAVAWRRFRA